MIKKTLIIISLFVILLTACQAEPTQAPAQNGEAFELYLVADVQIAGPDLKNYELAELPLAEDPILTTDDIDNYIWNVHAINLTQDAYKKILTVFSGGIPMSGLPFVILANGERIYAGAFWSHASSLSFDGVVIMQPFDPSGQPLLISLGYPTDEFFTGEDPRDDPRLRQALEGADLLLEK
jgi:hypothetical protein